jgi:hypothetical protein
MGLGIREKPIPDPGSRGQKGTGIRMRIRNTGHNRAGKIGTRWTGQIKAGLSTEKQKRMGFFPKWQCTS